MKIHLIGIAGAGMHSLALYLSEAGHSISGSDPGAGTQTVSFWKRRGVRVFTVQKAENINNAELVIYSAAVPADNPERAAAEKLDIACSRGEALARFANLHARSIAVCGTHGKGTTAAAISMLLEQSGLRVSDILGATPIGRTQPTRFVPDADCLVCEVDESDRTNCFHRPAVMLINNIEVDHLNTYKNLEDIVETFERHVRACLTHGTCVVLHYSGIGAPLLYDKLTDCPQILWVAPESAIEVPALAYHIEPPDDSGCCRITMRDADGSFVQMMPALGGRANARNIAAATAVGRCFDIPLDNIAKILVHYKGMQNRCEIKNIGGILLATDYASHPTCIKNDLEWLRTQACRVIAVYHPYRYTLMQCHWKELARALAHADKVMILPFDPCGEAPIEGISSPNLAEIIHRAGCADATAFDSFKECFRAVSRETRDEDIVIVFAGNAAFAMAENALRTTAGKKPKN